MVSFKNVCASEISITPPMGQRILRDTEATIQGPVVCTCEDKRRAVRWTVPNGPRGLTVRSTWSQGRSFLTEAS
jgi:hypothetical protein